MHRNIPIRWFILLALLAGFFHPLANARAARTAQESQVTAYDLIVAMNSLRISYGLPALVEDPIIDAVAQGTAEIMAANEMSWHIGNVSGRLASAGYGGGAKVWATENFAVGGHHSIDTIMIVWSDESHMIPAVNPAYCNVGAGVAKSGNGMTYYVLQAAYTSSKSCGEYKSPGGATTKPEGSTSGGGAGGVSQLIVPVKIATPDKDGNVYHVVQAGQSFWAIAIAYKITIKDIETWNNISKESKLQIGQKLLIPGENTKGYATPTPIGMIIPSKPDADGKIVHTVESYQTLSTIAQAYGVSVETILALNGIQIDWPLRIGQKLIIHPSNVTPSPTPRPLTPIEKLTPESDGRYYHIIQSGESLSRVADLYQVQMNDLMAWNNMSGATILQPGQKILLQVTPPATATFTPGPPTATATVTKTATAAPPTHTPSLASTPVVSGENATQIAPQAEADPTSFVWYVLAGLGALGLFLVIFFSRKK